MVNCAECRWHSMLRNMNQKWEISKGLPFVFLCSDQQKKHNSKLALRYPHPPCASPPPIKANAYKGKVGTRPSDRNTKHLLFCLFATFNSLLQVMHTLLKKSASGKCELPWWIALRQRWTESIPVHFVWSDSCSPLLIWVCKKQHHPGGSVLGFKHLGSTIQADSTCAACGRWSLESTSLLAGWRCMFYFQTEGWSKAAGSVTLTHMTCGLEKLPGALLAKERKQTSLLFKSKQKPLRGVWLFMLNDLHPFYSDLLTCCHCSL